MEDYVKYTNAEFELMLDEQKRMMPYVIENIKYNAKMFKLRFDSLVEEGFDKDQALQIVLTRGID